MLLLMMGQFSISDAADLPEKMYLPIVYRQLPFPSEIEPNNTRLQANGPLEFETTYYGIFDNDLDNYDIFYFQVAKPEFIRITLTNPPESEMQIQLHNTTSILPIPPYDYQPPFEIETYISVAGKYFFVIYMPSGSNSSTIYEFKVSAP